MQSSRTGSLAPAALVAVAVIACFAPVLAGSCFVGGDLSAVVEPYAQALADGMRRGDVLRSPRLFNGVPLMAHPVVAPFYPPQLLVGLMPPARALALLAVLHLAFAGAGAAALSRRLGTSAAGAVVAGLAFALSGCAVSSMVQANLIRGLPWMPWAILLADAALRPGDSVPRRARATTAILLALVVAMLLLSAEPFIALPTLAGMALFMLPRGGESWRDHPRRAARAIVAAACGAAVALLLLWPAIRYVRESVRGAGFIPEAARIWSMHPAQALGLVVPHPFGDPLLTGLNAFCAPPLVGGRGHEYFLGMHVGGLVLALALAGVLAGSRRERMALLALGALVVLALGVHGPAQPILDALGVDWLRYPVKWMLPSMLPLALLAGSGGDLLAEGKARNRVRVALVIVAALAAGVTALSGPLSGWMASLPPSALDAGARQALADAARARLLREGTVSAALPLLLLVAMEIARRAAPASATWLRPAVLPRLAAIGVLASLGPIAFRMMPRVPLSFYETPAPVVRALLAEPGRQRAWLDGASIERLEPEPLPRTLRDLVAWQREIVVDYTASSAGLDLALPADVDALSPLRMHHLGEAMRASALRERLMILGAAGVTHVITAEAVESDLVVAAADVPTRGGPIHILRNRLALPRARVVQTAVQYSDGADFARIVAAGPVDLFARTTLVGARDAERAGAGSSPEAGTAGWKAAASIESESAGRLDVRVVGDGGVLVISDAWLPGISAEIDGAPAVAFPADHAFIGVRVPPGERQVVVRYRPWH
jgi:hypothetical protein